MTSRSWAVCIVWLLRTSSTDNPRKPSRDGMCEAPLCAMCGVELPVRVSSFELRRVLARGGHYTQAAPVCRDAFIRRTPPVADSLLIRVCGVGRACGLYPRVLRRRPLLRRGTVVPRGSPV